MCEKLRGVQVLSGCWVWGGRSRRVLVRESLDHIYDFIKTTTAELKIDQKRGDVREFLSWEGLVATWPSAVRMRGDFVRSQLNSAFTTFRFEDNKHWDWRIRACVQMQRIFRETVEMVSLILDLLGKKPTSLPSLVGLIKAAWVQCLIKSEGRFHHVETRPRQTYAGHAHASVFLDLTRLTRKRSCSVLLHLCPAIRRVGGSPGSGLQEAPNLIAKGIPVRWGQTSARASSLRENSRALVHVCVRVCSRGSGGGDAREE